ncbi:plasmid stabilization protein [Paracoccus liaowanqingii]|uniref:Plasmid stabilization protein n=1 Tax=Paracoccus liaowanqingii TaxID=2560053 RepID=A0A4Z1CRB6_9RHOB|nr:plasmid stabilization protein [Paracoccus liaowanqingii]QDA36463.1 plasmid stabilization protein [Paracoccus liaowanqingii]TGN67539.1 plasmid stabilization protein [Paracoccus liaowanqingii]
MGNMMIRNLPDEIHDHLREQALSNRRSLEAEVRAILVNAYVARHTGGFGQRLRSRFQDMGVIGDELSRPRDKVVGDAADFS